MAKKSYRLMYRFWLDMHKPEEELIADEIEVLKNNRSFTQTIRDGIKLIVDLRAGSLYVLFDLFPHLKEQFQSTPMKSDSGGGGNEDIKRELREVKQLLIAQHTNPPETAMKANIGGLKPMSQGVNNGGGVGLKGLQPMKLPPPIDDIDDDDMPLMTITKSKSDNSATTNFLNSLKALQQ